MDCETYRQDVIADPTGADVLRHAAECPACAAYGARVGALDGALGRAVSFDVDQLRANFAAAGGQARRPARSSARAGHIMSAIGGAAAGIIATVVVWSFVGDVRDMPATELAAAVIDHWYHEPDSWQINDELVSDATLTRALDGKATLDLDVLGGQVSYAKSCLVAGRWVPHLVVQGDSGPFMVLLMPDRPVQSPVPLSLEDESLEGTVVPAGRGSIAVLGPNADESLRMTETVAAATAWTI